jgi:hypothetical protein
MVVAVFALVTAWVVAWPLTQVAHQAWSRTLPIPPGDDPGAWTRWWIRGWAVPIGLWWTWNGVALFGPAWGWLPLIRYRAEPPLSLYLLSNAGAVFWVSVLWAAITLGWRLPRLWSGIRMRDEFQSVMAVIGLGTGLLLIPALYWRSLGMILILLTAGLIVLWRSGLSLIHTPSTSYARAIGRLKRGHYEAAEEEILKQLDEKADDYEGWMMLAQLYAEQFGQLAEADQTVRELCSQPGISDLELSRAFTRLADWHLNPGNNPAAARAALEEIVRRCPNTPFATVAGHRLRQLPIDREELEERRQPRVIRLGGLHQAPAPDSEGTGSKPKSRSALEARADTLRRRLEQRPEDLETRLRYARLLAEDLRQLDAARQQLALYREALPPGDSHHPEVLALEASWQLNLARQEGAARALLERLVREHPRTPQAIAARRQLEVLDHPEFHRPAPAAPAPTPPRIVLRLESTPPPPPEPPSESSPSPPAGAA